MTICKIHQIYYSQESFQALDPGFIPLNNSQGRSDWMEYWPIRQYFMNTPAADNELIGFLSPRFYEKTGLTAANVNSHIQENPGKDIYLFNPYFHLAAWYDNVFTQGEQAHPGIISATEFILNYLDIDLKIHNLAMSSQDTVYCNYFIANMKFWRKWLIIYEFIFQLAENKNSEIGRILCNTTSYERGNLPMKIFIIERVASLVLLATNDIKSKEKLTFLNMGYASNKDINLLEEMTILDSLKTSYKHNNNPCYIDSYNKRKKFLGEEYKLHI